VQDPPDSGDYTYESFDFYFITDKLGAGNHRNEIIVLGEEEDEAEVYIRGESETKFFVNVSKFAEDPRFALPDSQFALYQYSGPQWSGTRSITTTFAPPVTPDYELTEPGYYALFETGAPDGYTSDGIYYRFYFDGETISFDPDQEAGSGSFEWQLSPDGTSHTLILACNNTPKERQERGGGFTLGGRKRVDQLSQWLQDSGITTHPEVEFTFELTQVDQAGNFLLDTYGDPIPRDSAAIITRDASVTASAPGDYSFIFDQITGLLDGEYYFLITETACVNTSDGDEAQGWILDQTRYYVKVTVVESPASGSTGYMVSSIMQADLDTLIWGSDGWTNFDEVATTYDREDHSSVLFINRYNPRPVSTDVVLSKEVSGDGAPTSWSFDFDLYAWDPLTGLGGAPLESKPATSIETTAGFSLPSMDSPGHYYYVIKELGASSGFEDPRWQIDHTEYLIEVEVTWDSSSGTLIITDLLRVKSREIGSEIGWAEIDWSDYSHEAITFINDYRERQATGDLTVTKKLVGDGTDDSKDFTFVVTFSDGGTYDGVASGVSFTLKGGESKEITGIPQGVKYCVVESDANTDGYATTATGTRGRINSDLSICEFTNTKNLARGDLTVSKILAGDGTDSDADWTFTVTFSDGGTYSGVVSGVPFTLKGSQSKEITGIPQGVTYTVEEAEASTDGYATTSIDESGTIGADLSVCEFTNEKYISRGSLRICKSLIGDGVDTDADFTFVVTFSDGGTYDGVESGVGFTLKGGQSRMINGIPVGTTYVVEESEANSNGYVTTSSGASGTIALRLSRAKFTNTKYLERGDLEVSKTLAGNNTEEERDFTFVVTFSDGGTYDGVASGVGFTLKGGDSRTVTGIPVGTTYSVDEVEANSDGYSTTCSGEVGLIGAEPSYCEYVNTRNNTPITIYKEATLQLIATKKAIGKALVEGQFNFAVFEGDTQVAVATNTADGKVTFSQIIYIEPGVHTYTVKETSVSAGGWTVDSTVYTVKVTVTDQGEETLVASVEYPSGGVVFTNTYTTTTPIPHPNTQPNRNQQIPISGGTPKTGDANLGLLMMVCVPLLAGSISLALSRRRRRK